MELLNRHGLHLAPPQRRAIEQKMAEALREPSYPYPWESLEGEMARRGLSHFPIVGYGSLLNSGSAARTLRDDRPVRRRPVVAFGVRRIFNYQMPPGVERYPPPTHPRARAALNVRLTREINDVMNGIVLDTSLRDIPAMRAREVGYDLVPVACLGWTAIEDPPFLAHILCCPDEVRNGERRTSDAIEPHGEYYQVCREGAADFGAAFLRFWLATTYLADGVTPVAAWEATAFPRLRGPGGHEGAP
ncbi:MAG: hypothetical protein ACE5IQ_06350 [Candidatus Methylomirabilales bacterium]